MPEDCQVVVEVGVVALTLTVMRLVAMAAWEVVAKSGFGRIR